MADDTARYKFVVKNFKPETMPFGRLLEYYQELAKMIGQQENMHLIDIVESSHGSQFKFSPRYEKSVTERLVALSEGTAPKNSITAREKLNKMLADDSTSGEFSDPTGRNIIQFPGNSKKTPILVRVRGAATFTGELYHIAGSESGDAKVRIKTELYGVVYCSTTKSIAKALRDFLFEQVRVSGRGMWIKGDDGNWLIDDFTITDFNPVQKEDLRAAVERIKSLDIDWPTNVIEKIDELNEKVI